MTTKERKTILKAIRALDDWVVMYGAPCCTTEQVKVTSERIYQNGGTLAYATQVRTELEALLK